MKSIKPIILFGLGIALSMAFMHSAPPRRGSIKPIYIGQMKLFSFFVPLDAKRIFNPAENRTQIACDSGEVNSMVFNLPGDWTGTSLDLHKRLMKEGGQGASLNVKVSNTVSGLPFQYSENRREWQGQTLYETYASYFHNDLCVTITYTQLRADTNARNRVIKSFHWGVMENKLYGKNITHSYAYLIDTTAKTLKGNCERTTPETYTFCPEISIKEIKYPDFELTLTDSAINSVKRKNNPILFERLTEKTIGNGYVMLSPANKGNDWEYIVEAGFYTNSIFNAFTAEKDLKFQFYKMRFHVYIDTPKKDLIARGKGGTWESLELPFSVADYHITWFKTMMELYNR